jgi:hypothetical protein
MMFSDAVSSVLRDNGRWAITLAGCILPGPMFYDKRVRSSRVLYGAIVSCRLLLVCKCMTRTLQHAFSICGDG